MPAPTEWIIQQAIVDVRYERGIVYLDKCGSLMLALEDELGKPFTGAVPTMDHAELRSAAERLLLTYGPRNFNVTQSWVKTPARVELVAPNGWERVADTLSVGKSVTRCGVRYLLAAKADTLSDAQDLLSRTQFALHSPAWKTLAGDGPIRAASILSEDNRGRMRVSVDTLEMSIEGDLSTELSSIVPPFALALDIDNVHPGAGPGGGSRARFTLSKADLKEFIRSTWQRARAIGKLLGDQIGMTHG